MPLQFLILVAKVFIFVKAFITFVPKFENVFSVLNTFGQSSDSSKEVFHFLTKVVILVRRCISFWQKL